MPLTTTFLSIHCNTLSGNIVCSYTHTVTTDKDKEYNAELQALDSIHQKEFQRKDRLHDRQLVSLSKKHSKDKQILIKDNTDLIKEHKDYLEYRNCHLKELDIYTFLFENKFKFMPKYYGKMVNKSREIYLFLMEFLDYADMSIVNSENNPELWSKEAKTSVLEVMSGFHNNTKTKENMTI